MSESRKQFEKEKAYDIAIINRRGEDYGIDEAITDYDIECEYSLWLKNKNKVLLEALKDWNKSFKSVIDHKHHFDINVFNLFNERYTQAKKAIAEAIQGESQTPSEQIKDFDEFMSKDSIYRCKNCGELVNEFDYYDRYREIGCPSCDCLEFMQISKAKGEEV